MTCAWYWAKVVKNSRMSCMVLIFCNGLRMVNQLCPCVFSAVSGLILGFTHTITENQMDEKMENYWNM